jgi:hypothetical protein
MTTDITRADSIPLDGASPRWWRFGMVWFVLSGPALVVVAGFATMAIAFIHADVELHEPAPLSALSMRIGAQHRLPPGPSTQAGADPARQQPATAAR